MNNPDAYWKLASTLDREKKKKTKKIPISISKHNV